VANDGDDHIIFVVLVEQLGKNMDEAHKNHGDNKPGHKPNVESNKKVDHIQIFRDYFAMQAYLDVIFECIDNCFSKLCKQ